MGGGDFGEGYNLLLKLLFAAGVLVGVGLALLVCAGVFLLLR